MPVSTQRFPFVHYQEVTFKQRSDDLITLLVVASQQERENYIPVIFIHFQELLADLILSRSLCRPQSTQ